MAWGTPRFIKWSSWKQEPKQKPGGGGSLPPIHPGGGTVTGFGGILPPHLMVGDTINPHVASPNTVIAHATDHAPAGTVFRGLDWLKRAG